MELFLTVCVTAVTVGLGYALFATGLGLVLRASGDLNLAHGDTLVLATYAAVGTAAAGTGRPAAVLIDVAVGALAGTAAYLLVYGPVARRTRPGAASLGFLPALGVALLLRNISEKVNPTGSRPVTSLFPGGDTRLFGDYRLPASGWWLVAAGVAVPALIALLLARSRTGRRIRAVAADPTLARLSGVPVTRTLAATYALAGAVGGLAGALVASFLGIVAVTFGWQATLKGFVAAILGGVGWVRGALIGGLLLGAVESFTGAYLTTTYQDLVTFALLIAVLLLVPRGVLGRGALREV